MSHALVRPILGLTLLALAACVRSTPTTAPGSDHGPSQYVRSCAACHGVDGTGNGPAASALRTPPPDLTLLAARAGGRFPRDRVIAVIVGNSSLRVHGSREMPVWSIRFDPPAGATAVASVVARRRVEAIADDVEALQRLPERR